jgi:hypothetical protein
MRYEEKVRNICGEDWKTVNQGEKEGGYGVACMLAFMRGQRPVISELSKHLEIPADEIVAGYTRLSKNGLFNKDWGLILDEEGNVLVEGGARRDEALLGRDGTDACERAWAHIAAVAGGFIGRPN